MTSKLTENSVYINEFTTEDSKTSDGRFGVNPEQGLNDHQHHEPRQTQSKAPMSRDACNNVQSTQVSPARNNLLTVFPEQPEKRSFGSYHGHTYTFGGHSPESPVW